MNECHLYGANSKKCSKCAMSTVTGVVAYVTGKRVYGFWELLS